MLTLAAYCANRALLGDGRMMLSHAPNRRRGGEKPFIMSNKNTSLILYDNTGVPEMYLR